MSMGFEDVDDELLITDADDVIDIDVSGFGAHHPDADLQIARGSSDGDPQGLPTSEFRPRPSSDNRQHPTEDVDTDEVLDGYDDANDARAMAQWTEDVAPRVLAELAALPAEHPLQAAVPEAWPTLLATAMTAGLPAASAIEAAEPLVATLCAAHDAADDAAATPAAAPLTTVTTAILMAWRHPLAATTTGRDAGADRVLQPWTWADVPTARVAGRRAAWAQCVVSALPALSPVVTQRLPRLGPTLLATLAFCDDVVLWQQVLDWAVGSHRRTTPVGADQSIQASEKHWGLLAVGELPMGPHNLFPFLETAASRCIPHSVLADALFPRIASVLESLLSVAPPALPRPVGTARLRALWLRRLSFPLPTLSASFEAYSQFESQHGAPETYEAAMIAANAVFQQTSRWAADLADGERLLRCSAAALSSGTVGAPGSPAHVAAVARHVHLHTTQLRALARRALTPEGRAVDAATAAAVANAAGIAASSPSQGGDAACMPPTVEWAWAGWWQFVTDPVIGDQRASAWAALIVWACQTWTPATPAAAAASRRDAPQKETGRGGVAPDASGFLRFWSLFALEHCSLARSDGDVSALWLLRLDVAQLLAEDRETVLDDALAAVVVARLPPAPPAKPSRRSRGREAVAAPEGPDHAAVAAQLAPVVHDACALLSAWLAMQRVDAAVVARAEARWHALLGPWATAHPALFAQGPRVIRRAHVDTLQGLPPAAMWQSASDAWEALVRVSRQAHDVQDYAAWASRLAAANADGDAEAKADANGALSGDRIQGYVQRAVAALRWALKKTAWWSLDERWACAEALCALQRRAALPSAFDITYALGQRVRLRSEWVEAVALTAPELSIMAATLGAGQTPATDVEIVDVTPSVAPAVAVAKATAVAATMDRPSQEIDVPMANAHASDGGGGGAGALRGPAQGQKRARRVGADPLDVAHLPVRFLADRPCAAAHALHPQRAPASADRHVWLDAGAPLAVEVVQAALAAHGFATTHGRATRHGAILTFHDASAVDAFMEGHPAAPEVTATTSATVTALRASCAYSIGDHTLQFRRCVAVPPFDADDAVVTLQPLPPAAEPAALAAWLAPVRDVCLVTADLPPSDPLHGTLIAYVACDGADSAATLCARLDGRRLTDLPAAAPAAVTGAVAANGWPHPLRASWTPPRRAAPPAAADPCRLFVGGLPAALEPSQLTALFAPFGPIEQLDYPEPARHDRGRQRGRVAFVRYATAAAAAAAVDRLHGARIDADGSLSDAPRQATPIRVSIADPAAVFKPAARTASKPAPSVSRAPRDRLPTATAASAPAPPPATPTADVLAFRPRPRLRYRAVAPVTAAPAAAAPPPAPAPATNTLLPPPKSQADFRAMLLSEKRE
ncbi:hypothetical protein CXG81DRAFT_16824 [Caulochytrium protostelioides]|uniref:RRM domain-containing protein n=1 Tax=Caulochytrium protostelioides TaxID=1555241 RepID=A0A4P9XE10_9FUNG|nr:hypothetical protein CXG81DRAFT_16824 [Caulochytrium protostelioides]|eukprot:RKP03728.1 hypothetical protein CXG81DRAFT_16824 [Caulochytrium protostelioides]